MKPLVLIFICTFLHSCQESKTDRTYTQVVDQPNKVQNDSLAGISSNVEDKTNTLETKLDSLKWAFKNNDELFLRLFPESFAEFQAVFGYEKHTSNLYFAANEYIDKVMEGKTDEVIKKMIGITADASWEEDGVAYLQENLWSHLVKSIAEYEIALMAQNVTTRKGFFNFLFDGPDPLDQDKVKLKETLAQELTESLTVELERQFNVVVRRWKDH